MAKYRRVKVDLSDEKDIITGCIVSDDFCRRILPMLKSDHLKVSGSKVILKWVNDYWDTYDKAPGMEIRPIYNVESRNLKESEAEGVESILEALSDRHVSGNGEVNWEFQIDKARDYIRARNIDILSETIKVLKDRGDLDTAEAHVHDFFVASSATCDWVAPLDDEEFQYSVISRSDKGLFKMEGALGELVGWMQRGWLVAFMGGYKRGKTWWMGEVAFQAMAFYKLKVAFFSLEMNKLDMGARFMKQATALPDKPGKVVVPLWDCRKNQDDTCSLKIRVNDVAIPRDDDEVTVFDPESDYQPCAVCKDDKKHYREYRVASWLSERDKSDSFVANGVKACQAFAMQYNAKNLQMTSIPRESATVEDLYKHLDDLHAAKNFIPDVVVVDYADILMESYGGNNEWQRIDMIWKKLSKLAQDRQVLLISGSQITAKGLDVRTLDETHTAGAKSKLAHLDVSIAINQLFRQIKGKMSEREMQVTRLKVLMNRHREAPEDQAFVLQNLGLGQPAMDSFVTSVAHKMLDGSRLDEEFEEDDSAE